MPEIAVINNNVAEDAQQINHPPSDVVVNDTVLQLQSLLIYIIDNNVKGKSAVLNCAKSFGINKSYSSIASKLIAFKKNGVESLARKEKSDKGLAKSFSNEVLLKMQEIFCDGIRGGVVLRAYEDTHKFFRGVSKEFVVAGTGELFAIVNGYLCDISNNQILSQYTTKFIAGTYILKPESAVSPGGGGLRGWSKNELHIGSYAAAARFLKNIKQIHSDALFLERFGIHDFRNKRQHAMKRDYSRLEPAELIIGDGKKLDLLVISDDWRKVYRPWLMGWYDAATRRYCYQISESETSEAIANSLAVAIDEWGIPKIVLHDNGKSYLSGRFDQMKKSLNIKTTRATVKLARAKAIESFHNILDQLFKTQIGYTGNKYQDFPQDTRNRLKFVLGEQRDLSRVEKMFKEESNTDYNIINIANPEARMKSNKKRLMHISELVELLKDKIEEYHERVHGGLKKDEIGVQVYSQLCKDETINSFGEKLNTPLGRYEYKVAQGFVPVRANPASVAMYVMNYDLRTVQLKTGINFNNEEYYSAKLRSLAGERVLIRYTHSKTEALYVFHSSELQKISGDKKYIPIDIINKLKFVCIAERQKAIHYGDMSFKDSLLLQREDERKLKAVIKGDKNEQSVKIHSLSSLDSQVNNITAAEDEFVNNKLNKEKPYFKKLKSLFDD